MATKTEKPGGESATPKQPDAFPLSLDEFCTRLSQADKRVELIGGFHMFMRSKKKLRATEQDFQSEFDHFAKRPAR